MLCLAVFHWCVLAAVDNVIGCPCPFIAGTSHYLNHVLHDSDEHIKKKEKRA